jgi:hypothetical protein
MFSGAVIRGGFCGGRSSLSWRVRFGGCVLRCRIVGGIDYKVFKRSLCNDNNIRIGNYSLFTYVDFRAITRCLSGNCRVLNVGHCIWSSVRDRRVFV